MAVQRSELPVSGGPDVTFNSPTTFIGAAKFRGSATFEQGITTTLAQGNVEIIVNGAIT